MKQLALKILRSFKSKPVILALLGLIGAILAEVGAPGSVTGLIDAISQLISAPAPVAQ